MYNVMKNDREIGGCRWLERRKIKSKKEKTLQQQEGLPTLSVDLNKYDKSKLETEEHVYDYFTCTYKQKSLATHHRYAYLLQTTALNLTQT